MVEKIEKWREIFISKYDVEDTRQNEYAVKYHSRLWKDLDKVCQIGAHESWFNQAVKCELQSRDLVRFWEDKWLDDELLKIKFTRLYFVSLN